MGPTQADAGLDGGEGDGAEDGGFEDTGVGGSTADAGLATPDSGPTDAGTPMCGNGITESPETCDDGPDPEDGDGCDASCQTEPGFQCDSNVQPTVCTPIPALSVSDVVVQEGLPARFVLTISATAAVDVSCSWATQDQSAVAGQDYEGVAATPITIAAGVESVELVVPTTRDVVPDDGETFAVILSSPVDAIIADGLAVATINDVPPLVNEGLVSRYFLSEASSGTSDGPIVDAAPAPFDLVTLNDSVNGPTYVELPLGRGVTWSQAGGGGSFLRTLASDKIWSRLDQSQTATIEIVLDIADAAAPSTVFHLGSGIGFSRFSLSISDATVSLERAANSDITWPVSLPNTGRRVLTIVFDASQLTADLYLDGVLGPAPDNGPGFGELITLLQSDLLVLGNRPGSISSIQGLVSYVALYDEALSADEVRSNALVLSLRDDE